MTTLARIGDLAVTVRGVTYDKADARSSPTAGHVPLLRATNIERGKLDFEGLVFVPRKVVSDAQLLRAGDIVLAASSGSLSVVGKAAALHVPWHGTFGAFCAVVRPGPGVVPKFLAYFMQTSEYREHISKLAAGVNINNLRREHIEGIEVPLVAEAEQARVVEALDTYLPRLDAALASLERVQRTLKAYRASILRAAVEGRLVPNEAEAARKEGREYEPASAVLRRILGERRKRWEQAELARLTKVGKPPKDHTWKARYVEPAAPDTSVLPGLPEGWCWVTVEQLAADEPNSLCDGPFGSNLKTEHYTSEGPRVVRLQNIGDGEFVDAHAHVAVSHFESLRRHEVFAGDLIVASLGEDVPRAARVPPSLGQAIVKADCLRFSVDPKLAEPGFVMHALNSPPTRKRVGDLVHGIGRPRIGLTLFRQTAVPLPPRVEQDWLAEEIDRHISVAVEGASDVERDSLRLRRLRQSILKWAFEGKLVDRDPTDEPAEKLLARIRAERAAPPSPKPSHGRKAKK